MIPAFNEEEKILGTLQDLKTGGFTNIIVVDDGSSDATAEKAAAHALVLRHAVNRGMGAALHTGTQYALQNGAAYIVHFDADGQHAASDIPHLVAPLEAGEADIVLGSRYLKKNTLPRTKRYLLHKPAILFQNIFFGVSLTDAHNGLRAMNRAAAEKIQISQDRMAHASEIISEISKHSLRYIEVPVTIAYHEYGQGFMDGLKILKDLITKRLIK